MNNYYKPGPVAAPKKVHCRFFTAYVDDGTNSQEKGVTGRFYLAGNYMDGSRTDLSSSQNKEIAAANADNTSSTAFVVKNDEVPAEGLLLDTRVEISDDYAFLQSAQDAYEAVLSYAGASNRRDAIDARIVKETREGTYTFKGSNGSDYGFIDTQKDVEGWSEYTETQSTSVDTDKDGMPDEWEKEMGLDPDDASDAVKYNLSKEYTNLEVYLNELVKDWYPEL